MRVARDVAAALAAGKPVVALESSVFAQGLPSPANREAHDRMTAAIVRGKALAAVTAVDRGTPVLGLSGAALERFLARTGVRKVSARDLAGAIVGGADGATTVAGALVVGILGGAHVFATGGIGGVHRGTPVDESADLLELSRAPVIIVCAGAKAILDLPATLERLETLGVSVVGYGTDEFPGFYSAATGLRLASVARTPAEVVELFIAERTISRPGALVVVQPPPVATALDPRAVRDAVDVALAAAQRKHVTGAALTPFLLAEVERATHGASLACNLALLEANARLAAEIARSLSAASSA